MKLYLSVLSLLSFTLFSAQNKEVLNDFKNHNKANKIVITLDLAHEQSHVELTNQKRLDGKLVTSSETKKEIQKTIASQDIDEEINAILDYKVNRVLREDLFCLVCNRYRDSEILA